MTEQPTTIKGVPAEDPPAEAAKPEPRGEIEYVVLYRRAGDSDWIQEAKHQAKNPDAAIEEAIGDSDPTGVEYVAIASRYWSPQQYEAKVETLRTIVRKGA